MATKKRFALIAGIANLLVPVLGHLYVGSPLRGLTFLVTGLSGIVALGWLGAATSLWFFYAVQIFYLIMYFAMIVDAVLIARGRQNYELKPFNNWYCYLGWMILIISFFLVYGKFRGMITGFDNHRNVSMNMASTLTAGDLIATDTRSYTIGSAIPARGEIITFRYPKNPDITYVKRVVGLPEEILEIKNGTTYINGNPVLEPYVSSEQKTKPFSQNMDEIKIPQNHLFVLGDNRDNSNDSRFWGTLPIDNVTGKVTLVWFSSEFQRIRGLESTN